MRYDEFIGQVQHRAGLGSHAEAERATRATLETLAERLAGGEAHDLAAQLPPELARSLEAPDAGIGAKLTLNEFFELVSEREGVDLEDSTLHARVVIGVEARIDVRTNTRITALDGDSTLTSVRVSTGGSDAVLPCLALFSFIGADPATGWLSGCAVLDEHDFVLTDRSLGEEYLAGRWEALGRRPLPFETSYPGLFAAGDVRAGSTKRVAAAVGEGSAAVRSVHEYLAFAH